MPETDMCGDKREYIIMLWTTEDNKEHHETFSESTIDETIRRAEERGKKLFQQSALSDHESNQIKHMSIFRGRHITWDKEEMPVVKSFKLKELDDE